MIAVVTLAEMENEMGILQSWDAGNDTTLAQVEKFPDPRYLELFNQHMCAEYPILPWRAVQTEEEKEKQKLLDERLQQKFQIRLALLTSDEKWIGWSHGWQDAIHTGDFYMASSLVLPDYREKKLYSEMVKKILQLTAQEGFSGVRSRHLCTNNAVLIAKLKLGFMINGFEQDETMGTLVRMTYYHNDLRRRAACFRAGKVAEPGILESLLK